MPEPKMITTSQIALLAGISGLIAAGCVTIALIVPLKHELARLVNPLNGGNPSSPIKVRGGALTARTNNGWTQIGKSSSGTPIYCTGTDDVSWIEFFEAAGVSGAPENPTKLKAGWTLQILGRTYTPASGATPPMSSPSENGLTLTSQPNDCGGGKTSPYSVTLSVYENDGSTTNAQFYSDSATGTEDSSAAEKFQDMTSTCSGPDGGSGNEDVCERASKLKLTKADGTTILNYACPNGECSVYIGKQ